MASKYLKHWIWQDSYWPAFAWDMGALAEPLAAARRAQGEIVGLARVLHGAADLDTEVEVLTREGVATSAIEGETFDPRAVRGALARRLGLPGAALPAVPRGVERLVDVMLDVAREHARPLTLEQLSAWQAALSATGRSGFRETRVGALRGAAPMQVLSVPHGRGRVHYEAPPGDRLPAEMKRFLTWFNKPPEKLDGLLRAGLAHAWFELVHPFQDGNGRIGRAVLDRALVQDDPRASRVYRMSARFEEVSDEYHDALGALSRGGMDATQWLEWFLVQVRAAAQAAEQTVHHVMVKAHYWMAHAPKTLSERQKKALNALLEGGSGVLAGGMTNRKYAHLTKTSPATAQRDLARLVEQGCLVLEGAGRGARYELPVTRDWRVD